MARERFADTGDRIYQTITGGRGWLFPKDSKFYTEFRSQCDKLGSIGVQYALGMADYSDWTNGRRSIRPNPDDIGAIMS